VSRLALIRATGLAEIESVLPLICSVASNADLRQHWRVPRDLAYRLDMSFSRNSSETSCKPTSGSRRENLFSGHDSRIVVIREEPEFTHSSVRGALRFSLSKRRVMSLEIAGVQFWLPFSLGRSCEV
jgi:hypothetical protein